ncbi:MAG: glycosyl transferase family 1 [Frankiales bacterium]|nr:glycosyl transferase family 1 [Frankiales bacterium]
MRLLLDLQCVQSLSSRRGIGRYALSLSRALTQTAGDHAVGALLNGGDDPERLMRARTALETFLPPEEIHVFEAAWPFGSGRTPARRLAAEAARHAAIRSLRPDALLVGSVFEGDVDNVSSIDRSPGSPPTAALLFDLIPAADPGTYLLGPGADDYWRRFEDLRRADLLLAISDYSGRQGRELLGTSCPPTTTIWGGPYPSGAWPTFEHRPADAAVVAVPDRYLLAVGGDHPRKNLDRLVTAWGLVPAQTRRRAPLVIACKLNVGTLRRLRRLARRGGLDDTDLLLTGEVGEQRLAELYAGALAFVFPSTEEGLGMPPLEAMARGCPTLLARSSSLVELADDDRAFVDPLDTAAMARALTSLVEDPSLRQVLAGVAAESAARFTWTRSAELAWTALQRLVDQPGRPVDRTPPPAAHVVGFDAVESLPSSPAAVHVQPPFQVPGLPDPLGLVPAAPGLRAALSPAVALVVDEPQTRRQLLRAGLVEQPVVSLDQLSRVAEHDPVAELARLVPDLELSPELGRDVVLAASRPARWALERPAPVALVLRSDWSGGPTPDDLQVVAGATDLVCGPAASVSLAAAVDHVVVDGPLVAGLLTELHRARRRGTGVRIVGGAAPAWATSYATWHEALTESVDRRTGWPWRSGG